MHVITLCLKKNWVFQIFLGVFQKTIGYSRKQLGKYTPIKQVLCFYVNTKFTFDMVIIYQSTVSLSSIA